MMRSTALVALATAIAVLSQSVSAAKLSDLIVVAKDYPCDYFIDRPIPKADGLIAVNVYATCQRPADFRYDGNAYSFIDSFELQCALRKKRQIRGQAFGAPLWHQERKPELFTSAIDRTLSDFPDSDQDVWWKGALDKACAITPKQTKPSM